MEYDQSMNIYEHVSLVYMNIHDVNQISLGLREHDRCLNNKIQEC